MTVLLDTSEKLAVCRDELGVPVEQLLTPLTAFLPQEPNAHFAIDNGAFSGFNASAFRRLLARELPRRRLCRFVALPDVVGNARRTLECFEQWRDELASWPCALVAQDGLEDLPIPWASLNAIFIGGSTRWKTSQAATDVIRAAKINGKWVHAGRVNTPARFEYFDALGADSIDGTGLARFSWMREQIYKKHTQPDLLQAECAAIREGRP